MTTEQCNQIHISKISHDDDDDDDDDDEEEEDDIFNIVCYNPLIL
jgi:hypothetical protein